MAALAARDAGRFAGRIRPRHHDDDLFGWRRRRWTGEQPVDAVPDTVGGDEYERVDARRTLLTALATLSPQQRAAIVLRYFADLSEADTATALGCSVGAVKSHTARALARLRAEPAVADILHGGVSS